MTKQLLRTSDFALNSLVSTCWSNGLLARARAGAAVQMQLTFQDGDASSKPLEKARGLLAGRERFPT